MIDLSVPDQATLHADTQRLLPHTDPFSRQINIGLGCFIELARMAAAEDGFAMNVDLFPERSGASALDDRPVAVLHFEAGGTPDPPLCVCTGSPLIEGAL